MENYHPLASKITNLLKKNNFWFETFEHEAVQTSEEAAQVRNGYTLSQGAKAMIVRVKISNTEKKFVMLVLPGSLRFDIKKVKALFNAKDIRFATVEEVSEVTGGVLPGGIPPFGNLFNLDVIVEPTLLKNKTIIFNAGDRCFSVAMNSKDYVELVKPQIEMII